MTTEIEKTFFDTFGIEHVFCTDTFLNPCKFECDECAHREERYPQITDRILLELICILSRHEGLEIYENAEKLKKYVLASLISCYKSNNDAKSILYCVEKANIVKHQVRTLFKEG